MTIDTKKLASEHGITEEKLAYDRSLFQGLMKVAGADPSRMAGEDVASYFNHFVAFEKAASELGVDLAQQDADEVLTQYNAFVKAAEDEKDKAEKEKGEKKDEKEEEKKAAQLEALAVAEAQKLASVSAAEAFYRHLGETAADAYAQRLEKIAAEGAAPAAAEGAADAAKKDGKMKALGDWVAGKAKDARSAAESAYDSAKKDPKGAAKTIGKGVAGVAGLAAAGVGVKKLYDHHKAKASEAKQAFDLLAAKVAREMLAAENYDLNEGTTLLNGVLVKAAEEVEYSEQVKQASAEDGAAGGVQMRALELLSMAGYPVGTEG